jgi:hypothetical protein
MTSYNVDMANKRFGAYFGKMVHDVEIVASGYDSSPAIENILKYIREYPPLMLEKAELQKKKRQNGAVPAHMRCMAKCGKGEQCSRRRQAESSYCGTHTKGTPHGVVEADSSPSLVTKKVSTWLEDINGIQYYIDEGGNVYNHQDIIEGKTNPRVVAKWRKNDDGRYSLAM